jgi:hypothetical protein
MAHSVIAVAIVLDASVEKEHVHLVYVTDMYQ